MSDHKKHTVTWARFGETYHLYCVDCQAATQYTTATPNHTRPQSIEQALTETENIAVTLTVQSLRHKTKTDWR
jgi:hypothetical protein